MSHQRSTQVRKLAAAVQVQAAAVRIALAQKATFRLVVRSVRNLSVKEYEDPNQGESARSGDMFLKGSLRVRPQGAQWEAEFPVSQSVEIIENARSGDLYLEVRDSGPVSRLLNMALQDEETMRDVLRSLGKVPWKSYDSKYAAVTPHDVVTGDIFFSSWGYDQTNVTFYQVTKTTPSTVTAREIDKKVVRSRGSQEYVIPKVNAFTGPAFRKKIRDFTGGPSFDAQGSEAEKWSGKPIPQDDPYSRRAEATPPHGLIAGDIFYSSWGYDQTNVDFYQVIKTTTFGVTIRKIESKVTRSTRASRYVAPKINAFTESPIRRKVKVYQDKPFININSYSHAYKWDGKEKSISPEFGGH